MKRRTFLAATAAITAGTAAGSNTAEATRLALDSGLDQSPLLTDRLLDAFPDRQSLALIGQACWHGEGTDSVTGRSSLPDTLLNFLRHIDLPTSELRHMTSDAIRHRIKMGNARDFSQSRLVWVQGWLLGETEARLCTLAALRSKSV